MAYGIVPYAFGRPGDLDSNKALALIAVEKARQHNASIFTQLDMPIEYYSRAIEVTRIREVIGKPPPTFRIAQGSVKWAMQRNIDTLIVIAAEPHLARVLRDTRYAIQERDANITVHSSLDIHASKIRWFSPSSLQWWTRSAWQWHIYNWPLMQCPMALYARITA